MEEHIASEQNARVLVITAEYPYGSGESFLTDELHALSGRGLDVFVAPLRWWGKQQRNVLSDAIPIVRIGRPSMQLALAVVRFIFGHPLLVLGVLRVLLLDLRHLPKNLLVVPASIELARFCSVRSIQHVHAHWLSTSGTAALLTSQLTGVAFSITTHRWDIFDGNLATVKARRAVFVRFISESGRNAFISKYGSAGCLSLLRMGVAVPEVAPEVTLKETTRLVCPANLIPVKGHIDLLRAIAALRSRRIDVTLDLVGDGPLRPFLESLCEDLGIEERVRLRGQVERSRLLDAYARSEYDCVILPSRDLGDGLHEGIPVSLMEAMAYSIPVISTRTGGIGELVRHEVDGLLVAPEDVKSLAESIERITDDAQLRLQLGRNARERILQHFDVNRVAGELDKLVLSSSQRRRR